MNIPNTLGVTLRRRRPRLRWRNPLLKLTIFSSKIRTTFGWLWRLSLLLLYYVIALPHNLRQLLVVRFPVFLSTINTKPISFLSLAFIYDVPSCFRVFFSILCFPLVISSLLIFPLIFIHILAALRLRRERKLFLNQGIFRSLAGWRNLHENIKAISIDAGDGKKWKRIFTRNLNNQKLALFIHCNVKPPTQYTTLRNSNKNHSKFTNE